VSGDDYAELPVPLAGDGPAPRAELALAILSTGGSAWQWRHAGGRNWYGRYPNAADAYRAACKAAARYHKRPCDWATAHQRAATLTGLPLAEMAPRGKRGGR
jgi:hypothetical protein